MSALFTPHESSIMQGMLVLAVLAALGLPLLLMGWVRSPLSRDEDAPLQQPVQFDHRHHVRDAGIDCRYCHAAAFRGAKAGVPPTALCMGCHNQIWNNASTLLPVRQSYEQQTPIHWQRVHELPDFAYFDHAAHTRRGVGCATCHGRVDTMARVWRVAPLTMSWCLDCHRDPAPHLRPQNSITDMARQPNVDLGRQLVRELHIDPPLHCSGCHR